MKVINNILQGTLEWDALSIGSIGGSSIGTACSTGTGRETLLYRMAGEILSGVRYQGFMSKDMENGLLWEPDARNLYSMVYDVEVQQIAMFKDGPHKHFSPDGVVGESGLIEIKSVIPSTHIRTIISGAIPSDYRRQCQWGISRSSREWIDFISYCPAIVERPMFVIRSGRDEKLIKQMNELADDFIEEMLKIVEKVKCVQ